MKPLAVFDCMVFLQGVGRPAGPARACFRLVDEDRVTLCVSPEVLAEVRDVLTRPKTLLRFPQLSPESVEAFVQNAENKAVLFTGVPQADALPRDPKDEPYLNLAVAAKAKYLVSRDRDLLDLMKDEGFRQRYPDLVILDPAAFLEEIGRKEGQAPAGQRPDACAEKTQEPEQRPTGEAEPAEGTSDA
jgi:putative PIN family toxin of toxin-antitoxin system